MGSTRALNRGVRVIGIFDIFTNNNAEDAANAQKAGLTAGYNAASDFLGQGRNALTTNYTAGLSPFLQNYGQASGQTQQSYDAIANALGLNGASGSAAAKASFTNAPGYQAALDAANENTLRNASRTGDLRSGATNIDLSNNAQNLQNQQWNNYTTNLMNLLSGGQNAATSAAYGAGNLYSGLGNALNSSYGNQAELAWNKETGTGNANANAALAGNNASANGLNAIMQGAGLAAQFAPFIFSDARVKEDIEPVGELYDGTNIYRYRYKGDPSARTHIGVMAQEIEGDRPDAVAEFGGVKAVDYGKATDFAAGLAKMLEAA